MSCAQGLQSPVGHWVVGNALGLSRDTLHFLQHCAQDYGDLVPLRFFWKRLLFVNHPAHIEEVLVKHAGKTVKDIAQRSDHALIGDGLFLREGPSWLQRRRLSQPAFHRERIAAYGEIMVASTARMLASWRAGETRDLYRDMGQLTMTIVAKALFGSDLWDDADEVASALNRALACLSVRVRSPQLLLPASVPTPTNLRLRRARHRLDRVVYRIIRECRHRQEDRGDFLAMLLGARDENNERMTDREVRDEVMTFLVGGYETAADLLTWTWYLLAQHPATEAKLLAELDTVLGDRAPTPNDLPQLPFAGAVISETLRLYPPAPALGREVITDFYLGGYHVPRGTDLLISQWVMHRDPRYFTDPESFEPERWLSGLAQRLPRFAFFPFGGGPRLCIGHAFATMEMTLILAAVARSFRLELVPGHQMVVEPLPTLRPRDGLPMVCYRR